MTGTRPAEAPWCKWYRRTLRFATTICLARAQKRLVSRHCCEDQQQVDAQSPSVFIGIPLSFLARLLWVWAQFEGLWIRFQNIIRNKFRKFIITHKISETLASITLSIDTTSLQIQQNASELDETLEGIFPGDYLKKHTRFFSIGSLWKESLHIFCAKNITSNFKDFFCSLHKEFRKKLVYIDEETNLQHVGVESFQIDSP